MSILNLFLFVPIPDDCGGTRMFLPLWGGDIPTDRSESESVPLYNGGKPGLQLIADS